MVNPCPKCGQARVYVNRHGASVACGCHWFVFRDEESEAIGVWNLLHPRQMSQLDLFRDTEHP